MRYTWLLFDADHTLFDFDSAEVKALRNAFAEFGFPYNGRTADIYRTINQQIWQQLERGEITVGELRTTRFLRLFTAVGVQTDPLPFSDSYLRHLSQCGDLIVGAEETIQQLSQNYQLALITNGLSDVQRPRLAASPLTQYFTAVTISDEVGFTKPDPRIFDIAFSAMNQPAKSKVIIIGDSLTSDMQGGHDYGIDTCWFNPNGKTRNGLPLTFEIKHLSELINIL
ncbi:MAG: noncanonical pyrimidine nucleotidase, YjjG family [Chloroflexi bacterium]|nr:noncanonical pyrimidine nucleotidase, YjjG family [Chloroflexota bacterium]